MRLGNPHLRLGRLLQISRRSFETIRRLTDCCEKETELSLTCSVGLVTWRISCTTYSSNSDCRNGRPQLLVSISTIILEKSPTLTSFLIGLNRSPFSFSQ